MRARRRDENHDLIIEAFQRLGWQVIDAFQFAEFCPGFPDLIVVKGGVVWFIEVKAPGGRLRKEQREFMGRFSEVVRVVRTVEDVLALGWG